MVAGVAKVEAQDPQSMDRTSALYNFTASSPFLATILDDNHAWRTPSGLFSYVFVLDDMFEDSQRMMSRLGLLRHSLVEALQRLR